MTRRLSGLGRQIRWRHASLEIGRVAVVDAYATPPAFRGSREATSGPTGESKIVALYTIDFYADGVGWENSEGAVIGNTGDPVAVRAFQEPRIPEYGQDYQRIVASAPQDS